MYSFTGACNGYVIIMNEFQWELICKKVVDELIQMTMHHASNFLYMKKRVKTRFQYTRIYN